MTTENEEIIEQDDIEQTDEIDIASLALETEEGETPDSEMEADSAESSDSEQSLDEGLDFDEDEISIEASSEETETEVDGSEENSDSETDEDSVGLPGLSFDVLPLQSQVEAIIFASPKSVKVGDIIEIIGAEEVGEKEIQAVIDDLMEQHQEREGGFSLENVRGGGYQFRTVAPAGPLMEKIFASRPRPLSRAAQETLAIVAYRQPCTRADIEFIRGVDAGNIIKNLLERDLVKCVGRKEDAGRPMLFGTTEEFLQVYQINSLKELPPLDSFQPATDVMQNAIDAIDGDREVDVEEFIEDQDSDTEDLENTEEKEISGAVLADDAEDNLLSADSDELLEGATVIDAGFGVENDLEDASEASDSDDSELAEYAADSEEDQGEEAHKLNEEKEEIHGSDETAEMDLSAGDSLSEGSGEVDQ